MQLLLLRLKQISGLKQYISDKYYLSGDIMNEIIALMSNAVVRQLLSEIREACTFSLIVGEATDISQKEQLCIAIRWIDESLHIHKTPVELIEVPKTDAKTLASLI